MKKISRLNIQECVDRLNALEPQGGVVRKGDRFRPVSANARHLVDRLVMLGRTDLAEMPMASEP